MTATPLLKDNGFTLIETIVVIVLLGIISAIAIASYSGNQVDLYTVDAALKNHIRHAQSRSMFDDDVLWGVKFSNNKYYWMVKEGSNDIYSAWGADVAGMQANDGRADTSLLHVTLTSSVDAVYFNSMGVPFSGDTSDDDKRLTQAVTITLTDEANKMRTITITPETGFIP